MRTLVFTFVSLFAFECCASEWIPHVPYTRKVVEETISPPVVQYQYTVPQVYYQWMPYVINQPVITERRCLIFKRTVVENVPVIQWVYQPVVLR